MLLNWVQILVSLMSIVYFLPVVLSCNILVYLQYSSAEWTLEVVFVRYGKLPSEN